jgi:hypothetical protein
MSRRLYPEDAIVADYFSNGTLRLDRHFGAADLDGAMSGLSLIAANTDAVFRAHEGLLDEYIAAMRHPSVNPAYQTQRTDGTLVLRRTLDPPYAAPRQIAGGELLPASFPVEQQSLGTSELLALRASNKDALRELFRRLLVVEVPDNYL